MEDLQALLALKDRVQREFLERPGVTGIDVGFKETAGRWTERIAIRIHVAVKDPDMPIADRVPTLLDGAPTDVLQRRYELHRTSERRQHPGPAADHPQADHPHADHPQAAGDLEGVAPRAAQTSRIDTAHYRELQGGISIGPSRIIGGVLYAGTLGAVVVDLTNKSPAALTSFHVACVDAAWRAGDRLSHPSRADSGIVPDDEFGAISRAVLTDHVDGALIGIDDHRLCSASIVGIGRVGPPKPAVLGLPVRKRGRTTGLTFGMVDGLSGSVQLDYGGGIGVRLLTDQVSIAADTTRNAVFSDHGDSGAAVVDGEGAVVGVLFAGAGPGSLANPIAAVLAALNASLPTGPLRRGGEARKTGRS